MLASHNLRIEEPAKKVLRGLAGVRGPGRPKGTGGIRCNVLPPCPDLPLPPRSCHALIVDYGRVGRVQDETDESDESKDGQKGESDSDFEDPTYTSRGPRPKLQIPPRHVVQRRLRSYKLLHQELTRSDAKYDKLVLYAAGAQYTAAGKRPNPKQATGMITNNLFNQQRMNANARSRFTIGAQYDAVHTRAVANVSFNALHATTVAVTHSLVNMDGMHPVFTRRIAGTLSFISGYEMHFQI